MSKKVSYLKLKISKYLHIYILHSFEKKLKLYEIRVVQEGVLEFSPLCNDQQTHPAGITQRPKLPVLANMHHSSFNLPFMT
jgi:hypothetical protein